LPALQGKQILNNKNVILFLVNKVKTTLPSEARLQAYLYEKPRAGETTTAGVLVPVPVRKDSPGWLYLKKEAE
jgi:hypothetical protein